jgi:hypothetical protein
MLHARDQVMLPVPNDGVWVLGLERLYSNCFTSSLLLVADAAQLVRLPHHMVSGVNNPLFMTAMDECTSQSSCALVELHAARLQNPLYKPLVNIHNFVSYTGSSWYSRIISTFLYSYLGHYSLIMATAGPPSSRRIPNGSMEFISR